MVKYEIFNHTAGICLRAKEIYSSFHPSKKTVLYERHAPNGYKTQHLFTIQINTTLSNLHLLSPPWGKQQRIREMFIINCPFQKTWTTQEFNQFEKWSLYFLVFLGCVILVGVSKSALEPYKYPKTQHAVIEQNSLWHSPVCSLFLFYPLTDHLELGK